MYTYNATCDRVVDGDTVDCIIDLGFSILFKQRVRLLGIDAWESRTRDKEEKVKGIAAKERVEELLAEHNNKFVLKTELDKKGKYGRVLGVIYLNDVNMNELLVEEGHARPYE